MFLSFSCSAEIIVRAQNCKRSTLKYKIGLSLTLGFFNHYFWIQKSQFQHRFQILFKSMHNWLRNQRLMIFGEKCAVHISDLISKIQSEDFCSGPRFARPTFCNSTGPLATVHGNLFAPFTFTVQKYIWRILWQQLS